MPQDMLEIALLLCTIIKGVVVVVVTRPLPRDGGMAEYHGAPESGQLLRAWTRGRRETKSRQRASGAESP